MQILHTVIAVVMLIMAAYFLLVFMVGTINTRATLRDVIYQSYAAAGLALAALYVLHW